MNNAEDTAMFSGIWGSLALGAIGDTLGRPVEGWDYASIDARYGRLLNPGQGDYDQTKWGDIGTDDTALVQILCHCYVNKGGPISVEDYGRQWLDEMKEPEKFYHCMLNTYELLKQGYSARLTGTFNIATGCGIMAISPVGMFNAGDPDRAYIDGIDLASLVQRDIDMLAPGIIAAAVAEALRPNATIDTVIDTAIRVAPTETIVTFDKRQPDNLRETIEHAIHVGSKFDDVFAAREALYASCLQYDRIDAQEVLSLTFGLLRASSGDPRQAVIGGANIGRDADTIASLCGQVCGALHGIEAVPGDWVQSLVQANGYQELRQTAIDMTNLVISQGARANNRVNELEGLVD